MTEENKNDYCLLPFLSNIVILLLFIVFINIMQFSCKAC